MPWLLLLFAVGLFMAALGASSMAVVVLCVLASLGLSIVGIMGLLAQRVGGSSRSEAMMIDPQELRRLREQADARRSSGTDISGATVTGTGVAPVAGDPPQT